MTTLRRVFCIDTETTGFSPAQGHRLVEIAFVELFPDGRSTLAFQSLLNPQRPVDPGARRVHGLSISQLQSAPTFADIAAAVRDLMAGSVAILHNAAFDLPFLNAELEGAREPAATTLLAETICTLKLSRRVHADQPRHRLIDLAERYQVACPDGLHRAAADASLLAQIAPQLLALARRDPFTAPKRRATPTIRSARAFRPPAWRP